MKLVSRPARVPVPFADQGTKNAIPVNSQIGVKDGAASYTDGFPPLTMTPIAAGGIPPAGGDVNGILNAITQSVRWACAGGQYSYDDAFSTAIGGYPKGALIQNAVGDVIWLNTTDDNKTNPDTGTGWFPAIRHGLTTVALSGSNVTLTPAQAAKEAIVLTGTLTANVQLIMPAWVETWLIVNNTTGNFTVSVKPAAGSGVNLAASTSSQVYSDGTNIYYGALMVRNNLAEIKAAGTNSQATARQNIGCGTSATKDVVTSPTDTTAGRVTTVGYGGWGIKNGTAPYLASIFDIACSGMYAALGKGSTTPTEGMPDDSGNTRYGVLAANIYTDQYWVTLISNREYYVGNVNTANRSVTWYRFYNTAYKPTAADTNAVSKTGDTMTGKLTMNVDGEAIRLKPKTAGYASYIISADSANANHWYVGAGSNTNNDVAINNYQGGNNNVVLHDDGSISIVATNGKPVNVNGQVIPTNYGNFDDRYYTKTAADAKFLQGWRLGAIAQATNGNDDNLFAVAPNGAVVVSVQQKTNFTAVQYRYAQYNLNGTWYNAGVA